MSPSTSYQELYLGRFTLTAAALGDSIQTYFSLSGVTSNYFVDYVKFVKAPLFTGSNVGIGTTSPGSKLEVDVQYYADLWQRGVHEVRQTDQLEATA